MDYALLGTFLTSLISVLSLIWIISTTRKLNSNFKKYEPLIQDVGSLLRYEEDEQGQPLLDARLVKMIGAFSSGIAKSFQMSALGQLSGSARMEKGLKGAIASDIIDEKMPILNLLGDFMGINTKKYITKHPDAMGQLFKMAQPAIERYMQNRNDGGGGSQNRAGYM